MIPIQYVIEEQDGLPLVDHAKAALDAGCRWIQLSAALMKSKAAPAAAKEIKELCRSYDAIFMIEDKVELVKAVEADGIFLSDALAVSQVRQTLGEGFLIGTHSRLADEISTMKKLGVDYICTGPVEASSPADVAELATLTDQVHQNGISIPISAYGIIAPHNVPSLLQAGIRGITLRSGAHHITTAEEVKACLQAYLNA